MKDVKFMAEVRKWGNSLAVRLPNQIKKELSLHEGDVLDLSAEKVYTIQFNVQNYTDRHVLTILSLPELGRFDSGIIYAFIIDRLKSVMAESGMNVSKQEYPEEVLKDFAEISEACKEHNRKAKIALEKVKEVIKAYPEKKKAVVSELKKILPKIRDCSDAEVEVFIEMLLLPPQSKEVNEFLRTHKLPLNNTKADYNFKFLSDMFIIQLPGV